MYSGIVRRVSRQDIKLVTACREMEDNDESNELRRKCFVGGGLSAYVSWLNSNKKPLHDPFGFRKEVDGITMEIIFQWCEDGYSDTMLGYANNIPTTDGGTHVDGVKASITRSINILAEKSKVFKDEDITFSWEHVRKGLTCIVSVLVPNLEFEGQTQTRLGNPYVREVVDQSVQQYLMEYFELHPDVLERIISKTLKVYETDLAAKRARGLFRSRSVSTSCTTPEKLTSSSSDNSENFIDGGDSSRGAGKHVPNQRLQSKRTREQPRRNALSTAPRQCLEDTSESSFEKKQPRRNGAVSTAPRQCLEDTSESSFEKKRQNPENSVSSSHTRYPSRRRTSSSSNPPKPKDVSKKTPEVVTNGKCVSKKTPEVVTNGKGVSKKTPAPKDGSGGSDKKLNVIPIGPGFQADIPVWIAPTKKGKFYGSPGDSDTLRWLGSGVWPTYSLKKKVYSKKVGEGRSDSCSCASPRSTDCIKLHIKEARELLEKEIGAAFYTWKFNEMGEEVGSKSWTAKEEQRFEALVKKHPLWNSKGFWDLASKDLRKSAKDLISYYQNVFLVKRTRSLANSSSDHIDSDDDQNNDFLGG